MACATQLSIGSDGAASAPRDSSEPLALLLSQGLLRADRDDYGTGRPLVYAPHRGCSRLARIGRMAERVGFEPHDRVAPYNGFRERCLQLGRAEVMSSPKLDSDANARSGRDRFDTAEGPDELSVGVSVGVIRVPC